MGERLQALPSPPHAHTRRPRKLGDADALRGMFRVLKQACNGASSTPRRHLRRNNSLSWRGDTKDWFCKVAYFDNQRHTALRVRPSCNAQAVDENVESGIQCEFMNDSFA